MEPFNIDRFSCVEKVGSGGTTTVYKAVLRVAPGFEKTFSIRKIHGDLGVDTEVNKRFVEWASRCTALDHGNIVKIIELIENQGDYHVVTEHVNGIDLSKVLGRLKRIERVMPWEIAVFICMEAANALKHAHSLKDDSGKHAGIVHGNLAPSKIMLACHGEVKILGFASSRIRGIEVGPDANVLRFKYPYIAPERIRLNTEIPAGDIFSLGCLFFEMLTGSRLFSSQTPAKVIRLMERDEMPPIPGVKPFLDPILRKMIARKPDNRFKNATDLLVSLASVIVQRKRRVTEAHLEAYLKLFPEALRAGLQETGPEGGGERTRLYRPDAASRAALQKEYAEKITPAVSSDYERRKRIERQADPSDSEDEEDTFVQGEESTTASEDLSDQEEEKTIVRGKEVIPVLVNLSGLDEEKGDDKKAGLASPAGSDRPLKELVDEKDEEGEGDEENTAAASPRALMDSFAKSKIPETSRDETIDPRLADFDEDWKTIEQNIRVAHGESDRDEDNETEKNVSARNIFNLVRGNEVDSEASDDSKQLDSTDEVDKVSFAKRLVKTALIATLIAVLLLGGAILFYVFWGREWWTIPWLESLLNR